MAARWSSAGFKIYRRPCPAVQKKSSCHSTVGKRSSRSIGNAGQKTNISPVRPQRPASISLIGFSAASGLATSATTAANVRLPPCFARESSGTSIVVRPTPCSVVPARPRASPIPPPAMSSRCALRRAVETASRVSSRVAGDHLAASCSVSSRARRMSSAASSVADVAGDDDGWETIVGLELHVQLALDTKLFSGCVRATAAPIPARALLPSPRGPPRPRLEN